MRYTVPLARTCGSPQLLSEVGGALDSCWRPQDFVGKRQQVISQKVEGGYGFSRAEPYRAIRGFNPEVRLERLAEGLLRFVMLVTLALVEFVRAFPDYVRPHIHGRASALSRPFFRGIQQQCPGP